MTPASTEPMPQLLLRRRDGRRRPLGQALVEMALVAPFLIVLFAGAADFGRLFYGFVALENGVKEGALFGARYPLCNDASTLCPDPDNVVWRVENEAPTVRNPDGTPISPTSACVDSTTGAVYSTDEELKRCDPGDTYRVSATYRFNLITPILGQIVGGSALLSSESTSTVVNLAFDPTPGLSPTKLIRASTARNATAIRANCREPDPSGSPDYYRSPCTDVVQPMDADINASFRSGDTIGYKIIVRNNGGTNVTSVTASDSLGWPSTCGSPPSTMPVNGLPWSCTYTRVAPAVTGAALSGAYVNELTVRGAEVFAVVDAAAVTVEKPPADLRVFKLVSAYREGADGDGSINGAATFGTEQSLTISRNGYIPSPVAWYKLVVRNDGGQDATGVVISDTNRAIPFGQSGTDAICDPAPTALVAGGRWECRYRATFNRAMTRKNTASATASNVTADPEDSASATVTVSDCSGSADKVVPSLIDLTKTAAQTEWTAAGFNGAITSWTSGNSDIVVAQNQQAFSCLPQNTKITISRTPTP